MNWNVIKDVLSYCDTLNDLNFEYTINTNLILYTDKDNSQDLQIKLIPNLKHQLNYFHQ